MERFCFHIDGTAFEFPTSQPADFQYGQNEVLSNAQTDITYGQPWYEKGFTTHEVLDKRSFALLLEAVTTCVSKVISSQLNIDTKGFTLTQYHTYVTSDEAHYQVIRQTRDLYLKNLQIPVADLFHHFETSLGFAVTDIDPQTNEAIYVIIRINRPGSGDFNPPHKDVYHFTDGGAAYLPQFVNIWIPICGVNELSSLPLVPHSHLLPESKLLRTVSGGVIGKNTYNVRMIKDWDGSNTLQRAQVQEGEALFFTPHLIHGLAVNQQENTTRVSLEFRLFRK